MTSTHTFFAHRLGHCDVDCEEGYGRGNSGIAMVARDDVVLPETGRRWHTNSKRKHTWRRRCDGMSLPQIPPTIPPNNQFRAPATPVSHSLPTAFSSSAPFLQTLQNATRVSLAPCSPSGGAGRTLPASRVDSEPGHPHRGHTYSPQVAGLPVFHPKPGHSLGGREDDELDSSPQQSAPRSPPQNPSLSSIPKNLALDHGFPSHAGRSVPNTPSEAANSFSSNPIRHQAVTLSAKGGNSNSFGQSQRTSLFSFSSQHSQSFAASLLRLERTIQKYEEAIFEILNAQTSLDLSQATSPKDRPESLLPVIQAAFDEEESIPNKMSPRFRSLSGKITPKKSKDTPPRAIFFDLPEAYSAITGAPAAMGEKIPSPTPGMPARDNPYARLPPTIDLPETRAKHTGGPAEEEIKARVASSTFPRIEVPERPETPLLPPTPRSTRSERQGCPSPAIAQLSREPFPEEDRTSNAFGEEGYELDVIRHTPRHDRSALNHHDNDMESPKSLSSFGLETPSKSRAYGASGKQGPRRSRVATDVYQSSTLSSIIGRYNDDSELIRMHEGSERSIEISASQEVSSLSAVDDGEAPSQDSTAGHTPPLESLRFGRKAPERSTVGQPPRRPLPSLPPLPARSLFRDAQDVSGSEPTTYGNTQDLLNIESEPDEREFLPAFDPASFHGPRGLVFNPTGMSSSRQVHLMGQHFVPVRRKISDQERETTERFAGGGSQHAIIEHEVGEGEGSAGSGEGPLQPLAYTANPEGRRFAVVGRRPPLHSAIHEEDEAEGEPMRLRRQPQLLPGPDLSKLQQILDYGDPQSSSSQALSTYASFDRKRTASGRFQHDDTLASLVGEVPSRSHRDMQSLIKDAGAMFGAEGKDDGAVFGQDVAARLDADEGDDGDWETVHESGMRTRVPPFSITNREETANSLANMSSYASLTGSVPATPWDPLTGRGRVLTYPPRSALPYTNRVRIDTETDLPVVLQEYKTSREPLGYEEHEVTRSMRQQATRNLLPAFATTNQRFATLQERFPSTYQHPEPISMEHKHPFSGTPPIMEPTDEPRADSMTNLSIPSAEAQYLEHAENDEDGGEYATETSLVTSKKRNTQQFAAGRSETDTQDIREFSRPSNLSVDGSYPESFNSGPALSTSSIIHDSHYLPHATGTFSKTTNLGPKGNITGSFEGTGMRAVGSSEADYSTDSAMMRSHKYERLDDERTFVQAVPSTAKALTMQSVAKSPKKVTFAETTQTRTASQVSAAAILTKNGLSISEPEEFKIPTTLPNRNSFAISRLNTAKALDKTKELIDTPHLFDYDTANPEHMKMIQELIEMGADDWNRLQSPCPTFPLRKDHLDDFMELDGISTGIKRYIQDGIRPDGRVSETARCDNCNTWERSHAAFLGRQPFNAVRRPTQQEIGKKIVFWSAVIPIIGWGFLFVIANRLEASNDLIAGFTKGVIREFRDEEIQAADYYFKCVVGGLFLLFVALLIFTIIIVVQS